jgi:hypothetical protein
MGQETKGVFDPRTLKKLAGTRLQSTRLNPKSRCNIDIEATTRWRSRSWTLDSRDDGIR